MEVYIVMIGAASTYSYSGTEWEVDTIFNSRESAQKYIENRMAIMSHRYPTYFEFDIDVYEVKS